MSAAGLFVLRLPGRGEPALARGTPEEGPTELLQLGATLDELVVAGPAAVEAALASPAAGPVPAGAAPQAPVGSQPVWAAGVTFDRSREARKEESAVPDPYDHVYRAARPELFFKAAAGTARGPLEAVGVRADSTWDVPEPELALVVSPRGELVAATVGNDVSSRSIEGENPLYLPQAKVYDGSAALGPCLVPWSDVEPGLPAATIRLRIARQDRLVFEESVELSRMRRSPAELASWLLRALSFPLGAVLLTGTSIVPPSDLTLRGGDLVSITISGLGTLVNRVEVVGARATPQPTANDPPRTSAPL